MRQMRAQPLVIVIRQQREKPVRPSIGHALWFSGSMASGKSFGALVVRVAKSTRRAVIFPGSGPRGVFLGEKTISQAGIGGTVGEAAATLGLSGKVERVIHRTLPQRGGSPFGGSPSPVPEFPCRPCSECTSIMSDRRLNSSLARVPGDSDRFPPVPILSWSLSVLELRHGLSPARSRRPHGRPAEAGGRLSARNLYPAARQGAVQGARLPYPLSQGRLHERSRKLARTARRRHRIHDATAAQRRLEACSVR